MVDDSLPKKTRGVMQYHETRKRGGKLVTADANDIVVNGD